jgi:hypothetical protein
VCTVFGRARGSFASRILFRCPREKFHQIWHLKLAACWESTDILVISRESHMTVGPIETFVIEHESEADAYLDDLLKKPENRSMDVVERHADLRIKDASIRKYFIAKGKALI